jgi:hypothetical protein
MASVKPKRKHGLSQLQRLLQDSIRQELATKRMWKQLLTLSLRVAQLERRA